LVAYPLDQGTASHLFAVYLPRLFSALLSGDCFKRIFLAAFLFSHRFFFGLFFGLFFELFFGRLATGTLL